MKNRFYSILFLFLSSISAAWGAPRLVVVVVVDQLRPDYFERYGQEFTGGFKILSERSAFKATAAIPFVPTETAPGHAAIATGEPPNVTGIIGNDWYDRAAKKKVRAAQLSDDNTGPAFLLAPTVGDRLKERTPLSRVASFSLKDRSALMMGGHRADLVVWFSTATKGFTSLPQTPEWLIPINDELAGKLSGVKPADFLASSESDEWLFRLVDRYLDESQIGKYTTPDLLWISFSATDYIGHRHGPDGVEMRGHLKNFDQTLQKLLETLDRKVGADHYDLVLTADHGVMPIPESPEGRKQGARRLFTNNFERLLERRIQNLFPAPGRNWVLETLIPDIYLDRELADSLQLSWPAFIKQVVGMIEGIDEVAHVFVTPVSEDKDPFTKAYQASVYPSRSGDLLVRMKPYVLTTEHATGTSHGSPYDYDTRIPLFYYGPDFKGKQFSETVLITDIAPTLADILGLQ